MIALTLDVNLSEQELEQVVEAVDEPVEVRRIPWLVRVGTEPSAAVLLPHLRSVGVHELPERERVLLVAPRDLGWIAALSEALFTLRASYPLLLQTEQRRGEVGEPGPLRILDMEAYLRDEDALQPPPWEDED